MDERENTCPPRTWEPGKPVFDLEKDRFYVLDGGFTTALAKHCSRSIDSDPLWSARALKTDPEAVIQSHLEFARAGADILLTNTYQATAQHLRHHIPDFDDRVRDPHLLLEKAPQLVREALDRANLLGGPPWIAGSVGPYGAVMGDGSEYTGRYLDDLPETERRRHLKDFHSDRLFRLKRGGVDVIAAETLPTVVEALAILDAVDEIVGLRCWISFQCRPGGKTTAKGEPLDEAFVRLHQHPAFRFKVVAVGANCVAPEDVSSILAEFNRVNCPSRWPDVPCYRRVPYVVYPNSGERWDAEAKTWVGASSGDALLSRVSEWMMAGARIIGGCCRVGPEMVAQLSEVMLMNLHSALTKIALDDRNREEDWESVLKRLKKPTHDQAGKKHSVMSRDVTGDGGIGALSQLHREIENLILTPGEDIKGQACH